MQLSYEFIMPLMSIVQRVSSFMSLIIRNLNCIWASGLQTLVETARGAVWMAPRAVSASVCKPEAQIQLRFLMMSDITLETRWTIDISKIINSVTELHLVGDLLLVILRCAVPWILNLFLCSAFINLKLMDPCIVVWISRNNQQDANLVIEFIIPKFFEGSTRFEGHAAHHQELYIWQWPVTKCVYKLEAANTV
jgi:hypothetical protein